MTGVSGGHQSRGLKTNRGLSIWAMRLTRKSGNHTQLGSEKDMYILFLEIHLCFYFNIVFINS